MKNINIEYLEHIIKENNCVFLCGNGFSINFDKDFANIYDRLEEPNEQIQKNSIYKVTQGKLLTKAFEENYNKVYQFVKEYKQGNFEKLFYDGIFFAKTIIENKKLLENLDEEDYNPKLVFDYSKTDIIKSIANCNNYKNVNIEFWTILIYVYFAIKKMKKEINYKFNKKNTFISLIECGDVFRVSKNNLQNDVDFLTLSNGFTIYYKMLFSTAILSKGKALDVKKLDNIKKINLPILTNFLSNFKLIMTLNYDSILENLLKKDIIHLHGSFIKNKCEYVYLQSLGINIEDTYISFSDILLGDYFYKTQTAILYDLFQNNLNKNIPHLSKVIDEKFSINNIDTVFIFGLNIENDEHILRTIMLELYKINSKNKKVIYSYFTEEDKEIFEKQYYKCITFRNDISEEVKNIPLLGIKTQEILDKIFFK